MSKLAKLIACIVVLGLLCVTLPGCNTVAGAGKDIQSGGEAIEKAAK